MRKRLRFLVAATTSAVVIAFLVPLLLLVRQLASDRAATAALQDAQRVALVASTGADTDQIAALIDALSAGTGQELTAVLPDGSVVGAPVTGDVNVERALAGSAFEASVGEGLAQYVPAVTTDGPLVVRALVPEEELRRGVARASVTISLLGFLLLATALVTADQLARTASRPFHDLAAAADEMREGRLDLRVPEEGLPEAVAVARALNRLAERVEGLLAAERRAVADLSHRLRTPVTALRLDADAVADQDLAERLRNHVGQLERTVDAIVKDARRPVRVSVSASCDAAAVVSSRVQFWSVLAEDQGRRMDVDIPDHRRLLARIDAAELADVVDVLIDNVFAHTPDGVPLSVEVSESGDDVVVAVGDGGPGMPADDVVARGVSRGGSSGLGLDIAVRAAIAGGGGLDVTRSPLGGALVRVRIKRAQP